MPSLGRSVVWRVLDVLGRLGGALLLPQRTLIGVLTRGGGSLFEVLLLALLTGVVVEPIRAGQVVLMVRSDVIDGVVMALQTLVGRFTPALLGAVGGALVLVAVARARGVLPELGFDRALDACAYALVPHLVLAVVGASLAQLGLDLWFLPHHPLRGRGLDLWWRGLAGLGWSLALWGLLLRHTLRVPSSRAP